MSGSGTMSAAGAEVEFSIELWTWATEHGEPESASTDLLISRLAAGQLPPYTLVWKEGWAEWLPAMQVEELSQAFPEMPEHAWRAPRPAEGQLSMPPIPIAEYPRLRLLVKDVRRQVSPDAPAVGRAESASLQPGVAVDFDCPEREVITSQVPAAALIEAARAMTDPSPPADLGLVEAIRSSSRPPPSPRRYRASRGSALGAGDAGAFPLTDEDLWPERASQLPDVEAIPPLRSAAPLAAELGFPALLGPSQPPPGAVRIIRDHGTWLALAALGLGVAALFSLRWLSPGHDASGLREARSGATDGEAAAAGSAARSTPATARGVGACRLSRDPVRLDDWAIADVPPQLVLLPASARLPPRGAPAVAWAPAAPAPPPLAGPGTEPPLVDLGAELPILPGNMPFLAAGDEPAVAGDDSSGPQVLLGYAQSHKRAVGLTLALDTLSVGRQTAQQLERQIFSVIPLTSGPDVSFHVERMGASVACSRALDTEPPLRIGMNEEGVVVGGLDQRAAKVWGLPRGTVISVPAVAGHERGYTVATMAGRKQGPVRVGVMSRAGEPLSRLGQIGEDDALFGRPALASNERQTVLAVAARSKSGPEQSIWLARADNGELPLVLQPFDAGSEGEIGGDGADLDAPALAALPGGSFALLYSQGRGTKRSVRMQQLSATLAHEGAPVDVTAADPAFRGAAVGSLFWVADRLLAFQFLVRDEGYALSVASLECDRR